MLSGQVELETSYLEQKVLIKNPRDFNPLYLIAEWVGWGRGKMVGGLNSNLMSEFNLSLKNLLTYYWVEVLTWDLSLSQSYAWLGGGQGGRSISHGFGYQRSSASGQWGSVCKCLPLSACLIFGHLIVLLGDYTFQPTTWSPFEFLFSNSSGKKAPEVAGRQLPRLDSFHVLLARKWWEQQQWPPSPALGSLPGFVGWSVRLEQ